MVERRFERRVDDEFVARLGGEAAKHELIAPRLADDRGLGRMADDSGGVDDRDRSDAAQPRACRLQARDPFLRGRLGSADTAAVDRELAEGSIAGGERFVHVLGQDAREVARARIGAAQRLRLPEPQVQRP